MWVDGSGIAGTPYPTREDILNATGIRRPLLTTAKYRSRSVVTRRNATPFLRFDLYYLAADAPGLSSHRFVASNTANTLAVSALSRTSALPVISTLSRP
jgi:hypothetical protein